MPMIRATSSGPDWIAALAGGLQGLSRGIGDIQEEDRLREEQAAREEERRATMELQRQQLTEAMTLRREAADRQAREDAGKELDHARTTYGSDQDVPDALTALARRAGRADDLVTRPVDPNVRGGLAAMGASTLPTPSTRFVPTAAEREQRTTRDQVAQIADRLRPTNPEAATSLDLGTATNKYPVMSPDMLRPKLTPQQETQQAVDRAVATQQALLPIKMTEAEQRARIEAKFRPPKDVGSMSPAQATATRQLADDYARDSKEFKERAMAFDSIYTASQSDSPGGDMSLIYGYMKMMDPGSVVRESEYATAQNAAGVPEKIRNLYNNVINGSRLTPGQRKDFVGQARSLYKTAKARQDRITKTYSDRATRQGLDPANVVMDYGAISPLDEPQAGPANPVAPPAATATAHKVGDPVTIKGKQLRITKLYPDGTFDAEP